jgi:hypothetical protein
MYRVISSLVLACFLVGCSATQVATATSDVTAFANAAEQILTSLPAGSVAPDTQSQVASYVDGIEAAEVALNGVQSGNSTMATQLVTDGQALLPVVAGVLSGNPNISQDVTLALSALKVLLPVVAGELGVPAPTTSAAPAVLSVIPPMDLATARAMFGAKH